MFTSIKGFKKILAIVFILGALLWIGMDSTKITFIQTSKQQPSSSSNNNNVVSGGGGVGGYSSNEQGFNNNKNNNLKDQVKSLIELLDHVTSARKQSNPPQLTDHQLIGISTPFKLISGLGQRKPQVLIFGVGFDSLFWIRANKKGTTIFLEDNDEWLTRTRNVVFTLIKPEENLDYEAYPVTYKGDVSNPEKFFSQPWVINVPKEIETRCFDVILVDAPAGYRPHHPGRMESAYYALKNAQSCIMETRQKEEVYVYLHDMDRPVEVEIGKRYFDANGERILTQGGEYGRLHGWRITKDTLISQTGDAVIADK